MIPDFAETLIEPRCGGAIRLVAGAACCTGTGEAGAVTEAIES